MEIHDKGRIGPWRLEAKLGKGGNATVWRASRDGDEGPYALKVIDATKPTREQYQRFVREIGFLRSITDPDGVLPLIDAYLPEAPSKEDRPWLAMPIASRIDQALLGAPLEMVVEALRDIAHTLARLKAEAGVAHRDLKPTNLYELSGRWLVGDFGLLALPDDDPLTQTGQQLGPRHYTAYEMILDSAGADPHPADVYSFGKTIWVLATEQRYPPEGHQPAGTRGFSIADYRAHPKAETLDRLVDATTRLHPEERPTMDQVAVDLTAWLDLQVGGPMIEISDLHSRLRKKLRPELDEEHLRERRKDLGAESVRLLQELTAPLNAALKSLHPLARIDVMDDKLTANTLKTHQTSGSRVIDFHWQRCSAITAGSRRFPYALRMGRSLEVGADGVLIFRALVVVNHPATGGHDFWWESGDREAPAGSIEADHLLRSAADELGVRLREALEVFVERAPDGAE